LVNMAVAMGLKVFLQVATLGAVSGVAIRALIAHSLLTGISLGCSAAYFTAALLEMCLRAPRAVCALDVRSAPPIPHQTSGISNYLVSTNHVI